MNIDRATIVENQNVPSVCTYELDHYNISKNYRKRLRYSS